MQRLRFVFALGLAGLLAPTLPAQNHHDAAKADAHKDAKPDSAAPEMKNPLAPDARGC